MAENEGNDSQRSITVKVEKSKRELELEQELAEKQETETNETFNLDRTKINLLQTFPDAHREEILNAETEDDLKGLVDGWIRDAQALQTRKPPSVGSAKLQLPKKESLARREFETEKEAIEYYARILSDPSNPEYEEALLLKPDAERQVYTYLSKNKFDEVVLSKSPKIPTKSFPDGLPENFNHHQYKQYLIELIDKRKHKQGFEVSYK